MQTCDPARIHALADGALEAGAAQALREHLGGCPRCQGVLTDALLMDGLAQSYPVAPGTQEVPAVPIRAPGPPRRRWALGIAGTFAVAAGMVLWVAPRGDRSADSRAVFASITAQPREHEWRLAYPPADRHRVYDGPRAGSATGRAALFDLSVIERARDPHALAAAQLLAGMAGQAEAHLRRLPASPEVLSDRAVAALALGDHAKALDLVDRALAQRPQLPQALWNKALLLERTGDAAGAARLFERVADLGEPGWAAEARTRAVRR